MTDPSVLLKRDTTHSGAALTLGRVKAGKLQKPQRREAYTIQLS